MLLLVSWLILWCGASSLGLRLLGLEATSAWQALLAGISAMMLLVQLWCFVLPGQYFGVLILLYTLAELTRAKHRAWIRNMLGGMMNPTCLLLLLCCLLPAIQASWINDDKAYYLQSLQWYSEEGWVQGLGNLNIRYALGSGWHALSAAFYWEALPERIWNFNGLLLFCFFMEILRRHSNLWLLMPAMLLGIPFVNAPSPDLPLILVSAYIVLNYKTIEAKEWMLLLALFISIKATALPLLLLGFIPLFRFGKQLLPHVWIPLLACLVFMGRNLLLSGHLLFPIDSDWFGAGYRDHIIPHAIMQEFRDGVMAEIYGLGFKGSDWQHAALNFWDRLTGLFTLRPYKVIMNLLFVFSCVWLPWHFRNEKIKGIPLMSILVLLGAVLWLVSAPNYRFSLGITVAALAMIIGNLMQSFRVRSGVRRAKSGGENEGPVAENVWWSRRTSSAIALVCLVAVSVGMNTLGLRSLTILSCAPEKTVGMEQLLYPVPCNDATYTTEFTGFGSTKEFQVPDDCIYCGNIPKPCYPDSVRVVNERHGYYLSRCNFGQFKLSQPWEFSLPPDKPE